MQQWSSGTQKCCWSSLLVGLGVVEAAGAPATRRYRFLSLLGGWSFLERSEVLWWVRRYPTPFCWAGVQSSCFPKGCLLGAFSGVRQEPLPPAPALGSSRAEPPCNLLGFHTPTLRTPPRGRLEGRLPAWRARERSPSGTRSLQCGAPPGPGVWKVRRLGPGPARPGPAQPSPARPGPGSRFLGAPR